MLKDAGGSNLFLSYTVQEKCSKSKAEQVTPVDGNKRESRQ